MILARCKSIRPTARSASTADFITYTPSSSSSSPTQLGRRTPTLDRLILPVLIVGALGFKYLANLPSGTADHLLELAGAGAGILFGLASTALVKVEKDPQSGRAVTEAGSRTPPSGPSPLPPACCSPTARPTGSTPLYCSSR
jgi:hypothetical protein